MELENDMKQKDFITFIKDGVHPLYFINEEKEDLFQRVGKPDEMVGDNQGGYLYYREFRLGYNRDSRIDEIGIDFWHDNEVNFSICIETINEEVQVNSHATFISMAYLLNHLNIPWVSVGGPPGGMNMKVNNKVIILFDDQGLIVRIITKGI